MDEEKVVTFHCSETEEVTNVLAQIGVTHWLHIDEQEPMKVKISPIHAKVMNSNNQCGSKLIGGRGAPDTEGEGNSFMEDDEAIEFFSE